MAKRVLIDCDTGVDDSLALLLALRSPELDVVAVTTVSGNCGVDQAARNTLLTLEVLGQPGLPPVARGEAAPLERPPFLALDVHGGDGLGGVTALREPDGARRYAEPTLSLDPRGGVDLMLDTVGRWPDEVTLIATGPLTNVARAILRDPERMRHAREVLVMGGAFRTYGNVTTAAEFNIYADPHAAQVVLSFGLPVTFVPLDVTEQVRLMRAEVARLAGRGKLARFVADVTRAYMDFHVRHDGFDGCYLHDPVTVALAVEPSLLSAVDAFVQVETAGSVTLGQTVADLRPGRAAQPNARVCTGVDAEGFLRLFGRRVLERA